MTERQKVISHITNELHDDVTAIYEHLMDSEDEKGLAVIKDIKKKFKELEDSLTKKEGI